MNGTRFLEQKGYDVKSLEGCLVQWVRPGSLESDNTNICKNTKSKRHHFQSVSLGKSLMRIKWAPRVKHGNEAQTKDSTSGSLFLQMNRIKKSLDSVSKRPRVRLMGAMPIKYGSCTVYASDWRYKGRGVNLG